MAARSPLRPQPGNVHALWDALADFPAAQSDAALAYLKETLCGWLGADHALWVGAVRVTSGAAARRDPQHGWRIRASRHLRPTAAGAKRIRRGMWEQDTEPPMTSRAMLASAGTAFRVRTLHDGLVDLAAFRRTAHYRLFYEAIGVRDRLFAAFPVNRDVESCLIVDRITSPRRFSAADIELAGRALRGLKWFHRQLLLSHGLPVAREPLSPAQRRVVLLLLGGRTEKAIAKELGLAAGTVHQYAVDVYRKLSVKGRTELAALWLGG